jgi:thiol:disulfide interchange protein DsbD
METLKLWLAYPMYLTAVWLAWVFGKQRGMDAVALLLVAAVLLSLALWWYEQQRLREGHAGRLFAYALLGLALGLGVIAARMHAPQPAAATGRAARRRPHCVHAGGAGCAARAGHAGVCGHDRRLVHHLQGQREGGPRHRRVRGLAGAHARDLHGRRLDQRDPAISAFLDEYHSPGGPLYVVFPADGGPGVRLPQVLSQATVRAALERAAAR